MSGTRLFAERFLTPVREDLAAPPPVEYDERRSLSVAVDGTPAVERDPVPTGTWDPSDRDESGEPWAATRTQTFVLAEEPPDSDHHAWATTVTVVKGPGTAASDRD